MDDRRRDVCAGARSLAKGAAGVLAAMVTGMLLDGGRFRLLFLLCGGMLLCALAGFVRLIAPQLRAQRAREEA